MVGGHPHSGDEDEQEHEPVAGRVGRQSNAHPGHGDPVGKSQIAPRRSDQSPKKGWITDDENAEASMRSAASVYERSKRSTKNGSSAGSAPPAKSVAAWPLARAAIARLSISARTRPH